MSVVSGTRPGRYEIRSLLGAGGMGEVYLARDTDLDRLVARKNLSSDFAPDQKRVMWFVQEAKAASALNHPDILTIYESGKTDTAAFIATEFVGGLTLRQRMTPAFDWSRNEQGSKHLALARGTPTFDVVLISKFK